MLKNVLKNGLAVTVGFLIALVLLELCLRIYNPVETRVKGNEIILPIKRKYEFSNPGIKGLDATIQHTKNSLGFRGPEIPAAGLDSVLSLLVIGGSTTECFYLSDGKTWPARLCRRLEQNFKPVWLNNAGLDGHSTFGHIILLRDYVVKLKPKVALFLVGINDVGRKDFSDYGLSNVKTGIRFHSLNAFIKSASAYSEVIALGLNLFRYLVASKQGLVHQNVDLKTIEKLPYPTSDLPAILSEHEQKYLPAFAQRLREIIELTRSHQITPVFLTQPTLFGTGLDSLTGVDLAGIRVGENAGDTAWRILQVYNETVKQVGQQQNVFVIDLANLYPKNSHYFYDFCHFTNEGAELVAVLIERQLRPYLIENFGEFSIMN